MDHWGYFTNGYEFENRPMRAAHLVAMDATGDMISAIGCGFGAGNADEGNGRGVEDEGLAAAGPHPSL